MKTKTYETEQEWLDARRGRITGSRVGNLLSKRDKKPLKGFYELVAERVAIPATNEAAMDRGKRLEDEAMERFVAETGKSVENDHTLWMRDDDENIAVSPDGAIGTTEAVEVKCLDSANHLKAWVEKEVPSDYWHQVLQYFIVNEELQKLYFVFYDPRMPKDFFFLEVNREDVQAEVTEWLELERQTLREVERLENELTF